MARERRSRPLSRDEIVETALAIVDSEGLSALTMRRLAATLGVEAMSLYYHVPNKEALLDHLVDRMRAEVRLPDSTPVAWPDAFEAIFVEYRRVLTRHPNMLPLAARRTALSGASGLTYLIDQGLPVDVAVGLYQTLVALTIGWSMLALAGVETAWVGLPDDLAARLDDWREETFRQSLRMAMAGYRAIATQGSSS